MTRILDKLYIIYLKAYVHLYCRRKGWKIVVLDIELLSKDEEVDA
jgi:hypothetical protein